ncbi:MAG: cysteine--tRNA ligase, partial [Lachnospiraceae bacterium]|nr:cysteine--tRNA ligase [Lachnospiraceae bacterium]
NKRNKSDFVLWFTKSKFDDQELKWDSPWGYGYPGWHIECSCISMKHLGEYMDIHCGGVDNIFPHHTNEIAQSESYLGHKWCNYWFHVHHLIDKNGKMSKSKGDFLTVSLLEEKGYSPLAYRMFCLQSHYRKPLEFSFDTLDNVSGAYTKLLNRISNLKDDGEVDAKVFEEYDAKFKDALSDDLNTSMAITIVYDALKADTNDSTKKALMGSFDKVLSLGLLDGPSVKEENTDSELESFVNAKIEERKEAKKAKDFAKADAIRAELLAMGIALEDTREGVKWKRV